MVQSCLFTRLGGTVSNSFILVAATTGALYPLAMSSFPALQSPMICHALANASIALLSGAIFLNVNRCRREGNRAHARTRELESETEYLAVRDPLTNALNRRGFESHAREIIEDCRHSGRRALLMQFDADKFKEINDVHGHAAGDLVLRAIADTLRDAMPPEAVIGRMGGDEFTVLVSAEALGEQGDLPNYGVPLEIPVSLDDSQRRLRVRLSGGVSTYPDDGESLDVLLQYADLALLSVKQDGRGAIRPYDVHMSQLLKRRLWEIEGVRDALEIGEIVPYYQPLVCARTGRVEGLEALARWEHPFLGTLSPDRFGHALRDPSVGQAITDAMMKRLVTDLAAMRDAGVENVSVGLNVGEADLRFGDLARRISRRLDAAGLPPGSIAIEVNEHCLSEQNRRELAPTLHAIRENGAYIALDDFGTGTSSITLLKDIPASAVKIDRSFIKDMLKNPKDMAITRSVTSLCNEIGLKVVAEGVETQEQWDVLRGFGVDLVQGYLFGRPVPFENALALVSDSNVVLGGGTVRGVRTISRTEVALSA